MGAPSKTGASRFGTPTDYLEAISVVVLVTLVGWFVPLNYHAFGYIYLLAVVALSLHIGLWPALAAVVACAVAWNFVFVPPRLAFAALHLEDGFLLASYFVVALVGNRLAALRAAADQARILAQSERLHQTLLDSVAHELKTPVAVFRAAVEQLESADAPRRQNLIAELRIAGQRLDNLVANLLNQSRLESGVLKPELDWCDARDLVAAARRNVGTRLDGRVIEIAIPLEFPLLLADAVLMEQALAQLLLNAALYTPPTSAIRVEAGSIGDPERIQLVVADQGPGIAPEIQAKIFDRFSRGPVPHGSGLGLGLSIVRGFMQAQGGEVSVATPAGGGTRFALLLPHVAAAAVPAG